MFSLTTRQIGPATVQTVNARELHGFLGNRDEFAHWIKDRIEQYGFVEGVDFTTYRESAQKLGRPRTEYALSIDMAKELSMVERTEKGKQARLYFIECERQARTAAAAPALPQVRQPAGSVAGMRRHRLAGTCFFAAPKGHRQGHRARPSAPTAKANGCRTGANGWRSRCSASRIRCRVPALRWSLCWSLRWSLC